MNNKLLIKYKISILCKLNKLKILYLRFFKSIKKFNKRKIIQIPSGSKNIDKGIVSLIILLSLWIQVPQWEDDWAKCLVDLPDSSCHWYVKSPDNSYGEGFDWDNAPWFDVNGLNDIAKIEKETVLEKLQKR